MKIEIPDEMIDKIVMKEMRNIVKDPVFRILDGDDEETELKEAAAVILKYFI